MGSDVGAWGLLAQAQREQEHGKAVFSRFKDGRAAEVFLDAGKPGSSIQAIAREMVRFSSRWRCSMAARSRC